MLWINARKISHFRSWDFASNRYRSMHILFCFRKPFDSLEVKVSNVSTAIFRVLKNVQLCWTRFFLASGAMKVHCLTSKNCVRGWCAYGYMGVFYGCWFQISCKFYFWGCLEDALASNADKEIWKQYERLKSDKFSLPWCPLLASLPSCSFSWTCEYCDPH